MYSGNYFGALCMLYCTFITYNNFMSILAHLTTNRLYDERLNSSQYGVVFILETYQTIVWVEYVYRHRAFDVKLNVSGS